MYDISHSVDDLVVAAVFAATSTATPLPVASLKQGVLILNPTGSGGTIYIGRVDVTTGTGFPIAAGQTIFIPVAKAQSIYIVASGSFNINYLGY